MQEDNVENLPNAIAANEYAEINLNEEKIQFGKLQSYFLNDQDELYSSRIKIRNHSEPKRREIKEKKTYNWDEDRKHSIKPTNIRNKR
jgi:hypothetical protein